jgi:hypothetical protein
MQVYCMIDLTVIPAILLYIEIINLCWIYLKGGFMSYMQNLHILLPVDSYEQLRVLSFKMKVPRAELVREGIYSILKKYEKRGEIPEVSNTS